MENGKYNAEIVDVVMGETRNGKEQLELVWKIGEETVSSFSYFTGGAKPITLRMLDHLGWKPGADLSAMIGATNDIALYDETYNGETRQKVRVLIPWVATGGVQTPEDKRYSSARAKSFLASLTAEPGADPLAGAMEGDDDDLPF